MNTCAELCNDIMDPISSYSILTVDVNLSLNLPFFTSIAMECLQMTHLLKIKIINFFLMSYVRKNVVRVTMVFMMELEGQYSIQILFTSL